MSVHTGILKSTYTLLASSKHTGTCCFCFRKEQKTFHYPHLSNMGDANAAANTSNLKHAAKDATCL